MSNNFPLLSIVIPVYNSEKLICKCLDSINKDCNVEIIAVDDGSTDNSLNILRDYAKTYKNIKVFHQKNLRVSAARNYGIKKCSGKYLLFVDSDDYIDFKKMQDVLELLSRGESLAYIFPYYEGNEKGGFELKSHLDDLSYANDDKSMLYMLTIKGKLNEICTKIYLLDIIKKYNIELHEDLFMGEDLVFFIDYLSKIDNNFFYSDIAFYYYNKNMNSASVNVKLSFLEQERKVYHKLNDLIEEKKLSEEFFMENNMFFIHKTIYFISELKKRKINNKLIREELENNMLIDEIKEINCFSISDFLRKQLLVNGCYNTLNLFVDLIGVVNKFKNIT